jgi:hypothetical protein
MSHQGDLCFIGQTVMQGGDVCRGETVFSDGGHGCDNRGRHYKSASDL